jgi:hypothetical protein
MRVQLIMIVNHKEFGAGLFVKKESTLSSWNYSLYLKLLWFKFGIKVAYGNKRQQWSNRN